jgi:4-hydroxythreonine-4-phosphate dehydrogenase
VQFNPPDRASDVESTVVIADDLSGAAECAAEFTPAGNTACLRLVPGPRLGDTATVVWDLDARDTQPVLPADVVASIAHARRTYVKIDSLLRGNWAALVAAVVRATGRPALMCPALPRLGRGLRDGRIHLAPGLSLVHDTGSAIESLWKQGLQAGHYRLGASDADGVRQGLLQAMGQYPVTVVDADTDAELDLMAGVLESLPAPSIAIGSAGLASAVARALAIPRGLCPLDVTPRMAVLVGSRTGPAREQLSLLAHTSGAPVQWWQSGRALADAFEPAGEDAPLRLYATRPDPSGEPQGRDLASRFVQSVLAQSPPADVYVATGGETARALCDALGLTQLDILGQIEPGVCLARLPLPGGARHLVIKSGSFGDPATLVRIARMGGALQALTTEKQT